jgi:hypothetical protein
LAASLTNFAPRQWLLHRMKIFFLLELLSLGQTHGNLTVNGFTLWSEMNQNRTFHIPKNCKHNLTGWWLTFEFLSHGWCRAFPSHTLSFTLRFVMMQPSVICGDDSL